jgi:hypothetical protein
VGWSEGHDSFPLAPRRVHSRSDLRQGEREAEEGEMNIYIICPVRGGTPLDIEQHVHELEARGNHVHFPPRDVPQDDPTGWNICTAHRGAIENCDEVHIFWDIDSKGSHFDLGMAFVLRKKVRLIKLYKPDTEGKSYVRVIQKWQREF